VKYPRPEVQSDVQVLAEIAEAMKNGHMSRMEARQKYPNLDLPELTPEEEAKMDAEYEKRKPQQSLFGSNPFEQRVPEEEEWASVKGRRVLEPSGSHIGNVQIPAQRTEVMSDTDQALRASVRKCAADVKRIALKDYPYKGE
jgi:hypothetical protein